MVLIYDGNSEIGAHLQSKISNLICTRHLFRLSAVANLILFLESPDILHLFATYFELSSDIKTMHNTNAQWFRTGKNTKSDLVFWPILYHIW